MAKEKQEKNEQLSSALNAAPNEKSAAERRAEAKKQKKLEKQHKKEVKRLKKEYDERKKIVPVNKRPIVCPPDRLGESRGKVIAGFLCRALIIFIAVFAVAFFVCDALGFMSEYGITAGYLMLWSLLATAVLTAMCLIRFAWIPGVLILAAAAFLPMMNTLMSDPLKPFVNVYNAAMMHLSKSYYYDTTGMTVTPSLVRPVIGLFIILVAAVYVPCLIRRVRILPPVILSAGILWAVFVYNLTRSNWGVTFVIASFSALLVMFVYDRIYVAEPKKNSVDDTVTFFGTDDDAPELPASYKSRKERRAGKKAAKKAARAEKKAKRKAIREHTVTVAEELDDYFAPAPAKPAKEKKQKVRLTPAEKKARAAEKKAAKKAAKQAKREEKAAVRRVRVYEGQKINAKCAVGGFAGAGMFVLAMILLILPALSVTGRFKTIESIDKKMEYYRDYVTALLMGDDPSLDLLAYEGNKANLAPHSAAATPRYYQYVPVMRVDTNLRQYPVYMRGWVGVDYQDGMWYTGVPETEIFDEYRRLFSTYIDPSETMFSSFYTVMSPGSIPTDTDYVKHSRSNSTLGFAVTQVNVLRDEEFKQMLLYMPSYSLRSLAVTGKTSSGKDATFLRAFGSDTASKITFADYFDGIYTSYRASRPNEGYASVSMLTSMKTENFYRTVADLIVGYNQLRYAVGATYTVLGEEAVTITEQITDDTSVTLTYTPYEISYANAGGEQLMYRKYMIATDAETGITYIRVPQDVGTARYIITANGNIQRKMVDIPENLLTDEDGNEILYTAPTLDYVIRYFELMTDAEKEDLAASFRMTDYYTPYVYKYYTGNSDTDSAVIRSVLAEIMANAKIDSYEEYEVTDVEYDPKTYEPVIDPETGEPKMTTYTLTRKIQVPAVFDLAADHNIYKTISTVNKKTKETTVSYEFETGVLDRETYIQRHQLVMAIVNYLAANDNFKYTLRPAVSAIEGKDPVDAFLDETHEGYCVQFASALTLMLREAGIPARYVEGYIAADFRNAPRDYAASYTATVRDSSAHAWVEVWYDGIGWLQYEATPEYYSAMYAVTEERDPRPIGPGTDDGDDGDEDDPGGMTDEELAEYIRQMEEEARRARIRKIITVCCVILGVLAVITIFFLIVLRRARVKAKQRSELMDRVRNAETVPPSREDVRSACDLFTALLKECGSVPAVGEFRDEYTARVYHDFAGAIGAPAKNEHLTEFEAEHSAISEHGVERIFTAIAAEEFGYGAEAEDLPLLAKFFDRLYDNCYRRVVSPVRRVWLWLFKQEL